MSVTWILEAHDLAKLVLEGDLNKCLIDVRIVGHEKERKLCFFYNNVFLIAEFQRQKESILQKLREVYKNKLSFYKRIDFVFYSIEAKNIQESKARTKEEQEVLDRGIEKLENLLKGIQNGKIRT
ncbi:hypothetical protein [Campylobacter estrildidarum]|uniref:Uncharacterized protein n=1 Tax=Campylobacter estrildidarum TaxID=2510189 RepID=A0A4U7BAA0_9BACT|nr:hypothetical protein [Campylobacter estrildidarum]TKX28178.1 hypothetical protein CQA69_08555 [Campylobacter estrildidarum]